MDKPINSKNLSVEEKLQIVIACSSLDENTIKSFCQDEGIELFHVRQWQNDFSDCNNKNIKIEFSSEMKIIKQHNKLLKKELARKDKLIAEKTALLTLQKQNSSDLGQRRGRLTLTDKRTQLAHLINEARNNGSRQSEACKVIGISERTLQRWELPTNKNDGRLESTHEPKNKLSEAQRQLIVKAVNEAEHANMTPSKIVAKLANEGSYIGSASSFYRILKAEKQLKTSKISHHKHYIKV